MSQIEIHYKGGPIDGSWARIPGDIAPEVMVVAQMNRLDPRAVTPDNTSEFIQLQHHVYEKAGRGSLFKVDDHWIYNYAGLKTPN